jgi:hypothetical protein
MAAVSSTPPMNVRIAKRLLVRISNAAPLSSTSWRMPESRCWKKLHVRPIRMMIPIGCFDALVKPA